MKQFDIAIIGGGPGGYVAAIKAAQAGKKVCLVEKDKLGGVCLNRGCIPTKTMLKSIAVLNTLRESGEFGIIGADITKAAIDIKKLLQRKSEVVKKLTGGVGMLLKANGVTIYKATATFVDKNTLDLGAEQVKADNIIIATGSVPVKLPIPISGAETCPCHVPCTSRDACTPLITSDEALELTEIPGTMVVIGGGVIGIEFAYVYANLGTKVTVIEVMDRILPMVDEEITTDVGKMLTKLNINIMTNSKVTRIEGAKVYFESGGKEQCAEASKILMSVGRAPSTEGLNIEALGLKMDRRAITTDEHMKTNIPGIYAIGDVNGKSMLAHTASMEGIVAVENILGHQAKMYYDKIPSCIYTHPEIASVGLTEKQAIEKYGKDKVKIGKFPFAANGKATVEGESKGMIKVIVDSEFGEILGAHLYGIHATDMIAEVVLAMNLESTAEEISLVVHAHPTVSEVIPEAFHAALGKAIHSI